MIGGGLFSFFRMPAYELQLCLCNCILVSHIKKLRALILTHSLLSLPPSLPPLPPPPSSARYLGHGQVSPRSVDVVGLEVRRKGGREGGRER